MTKVRTAKSILEMFEVTFYNDCPSWVIKQTMRVLKYLADDYQALSSFIKDLTDKGILK